MNADTGTGEAPAAERLLQVFRAHGIVPHDVRDGAHEAAHALDWNVKPPWTRERIARAAPRRAGEKFRAELRARAVEQLVCEAVGALCLSVEDQAFASCMEAMQRDGYDASLDAWIRGIQNRTNARDTQDLAARVLALAAGAPEADPKPEVPR